MNEQQIKKLSLGVSFLGLAALGAAELFIPTEKSPVAPVAKSSAAAKPGAAPVAKLSFSRQILPILSDKCFECHGPDEEAVAKSGHLRLDVRDAAIKKKAIVPGDPDASEMIKRIHSSNPKQVMPTPASHKVLTDEQKRLLTQWIAEGAEYSGHWAFTAPVKHALPEAGQEWSAHPVDRFVAQAQAQQGLKHAPEARPHELIRRASLDLIGLNPTPEETAAFAKAHAADADRAWEQLLDRLLADPRFGERWASWWLDMARYADTQGFEKDPYREAWAYRDWVIAALNRDLPFDQFSTWQLAGDLLPGATEEQKLATCFHRNTKTNDEGGTDNEEYRVQAVIDRTNATMQVWNGLTWGCAQCHTHKYDPIKHEEYYRLLAFFNQTADNDLPDDSPRMKLKAAGLDTSVPVMQELTPEKMRPTYLFLGGSFLSPDKKRGVLAPGTPEFLPAFPQDLPANRLGLAKWLFLPDHPLTARVTVNRVWARLFGRGIVTSLEDMGLQSPPPSHPELLDTLAVTWRDEQKWSLKALVKSMMMSRSYRQDARASKEAIEKDLYNTWLARGPRGRLDAEAVRDASLAAAGLLNAKMNGQPVLPPQPGGVDSSAFGGDAAGRFRKTGEEARRRTVYTFIHRTNFAAALSIFDAPNREVCTISRSPTNTPLQALVTLNDPNYHEIAQGLARRILTEVPGGDVPSLLKRGAQLTLCREPSEAELKTLSDYVAAETARFAASSAEAQAFNKAEFLPSPPAVAAEHLAALTAACSLLLNSDAFLNK
ncbi:MAG: hypothetical protein RL095_496 [Verrucomicrobiota bacterium]|jgi:hypothetical protein